MAIAKATIKQVRLLPELKESFLLETSMIAQQSNGNVETHKVSLKLAAIDTQGKRAVVAWFTAAEDFPIVNVTFSDDAGESIGGAIRIDKGGAAGRVNVLQLGDGSVLVLTGGMGRRAALLPSTA